MLATVGTSDEKDVQARLLAQRGVRVALGLAFIILAFTAEIWMPIATNHRYLNALPALRILLLTGVSASTLGAMVVIPMRQGAWRSLCAIALSGLLIQIVLTQVLVPRWGMEGAAIAVFVSFTVLNCAVAALALNRRQPMSGVSSISLA
jgi:O-antigen/teichoic acid export membrane protein